MTLNKQQICTKHSNVCVCACICMCVLDNTQHLSYSKKKKKVNDVKTTNELTCQHRHELQSM